MTDGGGGRTYGDFATARAAVVGMVAAVSPWTGALAAAADAEMARRAEPPENVAAKAISNALHEHVGRSTWENLRVLVEELTGAEGYLPPELRESEQFMQAFAVCAELSAGAEHTEKVRYLFKLLMSGVIDEEALRLERDYGFYASIVSELSMTELHILGRLAQFEQDWGYWSNEDLDRNPHMSSESRLVRMREWQDDFTGALTQELGITMDDLFERLDRISRTGAYSKDFLGSGGLTRMGRKLMVRIGQSGGW